MGVRRRLYLSAAILLMLGGMTCCPVLAGTYDFEVTLAPEVRAGPFTGRVYLFFSKRPEPRLSHNWLAPEPVVALDVENWLPGTSHRLCSCEPDGISAFPVTLDQLDLKGYTVQAVARLNPNSPLVGRGPGNAYSDSAAVASPDRRQEPLLINHLQAEPVFEETEWTKLLRVRSRCLSAYHGTDAWLQAAVQLPPSYLREPERRYPVVYVVPSFGGTHFFGRKSEPTEPGPDDFEYLRVTLDPTCPHGHHVFADSETNGPVGEALVSELLPELDRQYRTQAGPHARFVTGHSSGGWSSLWLQITYPDRFGGVWSTSPDPVDFRDFQQTDVYASPANVYRDEAGRPRPLAHAKDRVLITFEDFDRWESVLGTGGQLNSFEAAFSPRENGQPQPLWSRKTGQVDPRVAASWRKRDIRWQLVEHWPDLASQMAGKLHVYVGDEDTFYLDGAVRQLKSALQDLESDAVVELFPGRDHTNILTPELTQRILREMSAQYHHRPTAGTEAKPL